MDKRGYSWILMIIISIGIVLMGIVLNAVKGDIYQHKMKFNFWLELTLAIILILVFFCVIWKYIFPVGS